MAYEHDAHVARQDPTPTSSVLIPSPTIEFILDSASPTSCASFGISWFYNGGDQPLNLYITNNNVPQDPPPQPARPPNTFTNAARAVPTGAFEPVPIITSLITIVDNPLELGYEWPAVSVPPGWYTFNGSIPSFSYSSISRSFYVWSGADTSCLAVQSTTSPISSTASPTPSTTQDPSATSSPLPVGASSTTNIGTIIGISVAAVVVVAGVLVAWLCLARRKRKAKATGGEYAGGMDHRWNGLSSTDSRNILTNGGKNYTSKSSKQQRTYKGAPQSRDSFGSVMVTDDGASGLEKNGKQSFDGSLALSSLPVLNHSANGVAQRPRGRTHSQSSAASNSYSANDFSGNGGRRPSAPDSVVGAGRRSIDSNSYPPQSPSTGASWAGRHQYPTSPSADVSRSHSYTTQQSQPPSVRAPQLQSNPSQGSSSQSHTHQASPISPVSPSSSSPDSPVALNSPDARTSGKQSNRQSLGGKKRKPVPVYDPSTDSAMPSPTVPVSSTLYSTQPQAAVTSPFSPSSSPAPGSFLSESPQPPHAQIGHYTTRSQAGKDQSVHSLHHKSSFGPGGIDGKPLHYLIPDVLTGS
ncbi:hypothetical protein BJ165DRAFT_13454 [Panaeolus papilionaceus]|nr:hypothetical protein BJ165DRAFT_13454 [Panaeolus papilionaceus]